jgi:phosphoserine phosphatase RsbU/P
VSAVRTIGAITLISAESLRRLSQRDLDLLERLGRRAGTAVENARLNGERARIAHVLQAALLPESLPRIADAEVHARYSAAGELNEVGGDFYDVFARGPDRWVLVLGDVVGKGARAAGVTALARHTLRAAAMSGQPPEGMLAMLHQALRTQPPGADVCTVCLVTMTRAPGEDTAELSVALAGHPPPLLVDPAGEARQIGRSGTLLGVFDPVEINESTTVLSPGQTLLMYTDGVLDAGRTSEPLGERGLLSLCRGLAAEPLEAVLAEIEREALARAAGALRDDIALLGLRLTSRA